MYCKRNFISSIRANSSYRGQAILQYKKRSSLFLALGWKKCSQTIHLRHLNHDHMFFFHFIKELRVPRNKTKRGHCQNQHNEVTAQMRTTRSRWRQYIEVDLDLLSPAYLVPPSNTNRGIFVVHVVQPKEPAHRGHVPLKNANQDYGFKMV